MKDVPRSEVSLSDVVLLLEQQRYDEALPILSDLIEQTPSDREARMYRLLVVRILVLHHYINKPALPAGSYWSAIENQITAISAQARRAFEIGIIRSVGQFCHAAKISPAAGGIIRALGLSVERLGRFRYLLTVAIRLASYLRATIKPIPFRVARALSAVTTFVFIQSQSLGRFQRAAKISLAKPGLKRATIVLAISAVFFALVGFYMAGGSQIGNGQLSPAKRSIAASASPSPSAAVERERYDPEKRAAIGNDGSQETSIIKTDEWSFSHVISDPSELHFVLLPKAISTTPVVENEAYLAGSARELPGAFQTNAAKTPIRPETPAGLAKLREYRLPSNIEAPEGLPAKKSSGVKAGQRMQAQYESKRRIPVRESARFAAAVVHEIARGTSVNVLEVKGSWAKIEITDGNISGFVRKEFLIPVSSASR
jgi:hypothetical protein